MSRSHQIDRLLGSRRGVVAIEFALVAPFIMLLMLAGTDLTIFMRTKMRMDEVATEVALTVTQYQNLYVSDFSPPAAPLFNAAQIIAGTTPVTGLLGTTIITGIVTTPTTNRRSPGNTGATRPRSQVCSEPPREVSRPCRTIIKCRSIPR
jgi:hypothetical protein